MAGEHMLVANLFLNKFIKVVHLFEISASWMKILDSWIPDNREFALLKI
jgi:hypothetical protein